MSDASQPVHPTSDRDPQWVTQKNKATKRNDYHGELRNLTNALVKALYGGQIMVDEKAFQGITSMEGSIKVSPLDLAALEQQHRSITSQPSSSLRMWP